MTPGLHAWGLGSPAVSVMRHGCTAVRGIGLGIVILGLSAGVPQARPAGKALVQQAAFPSGLPGGADDPDSAAARGVSPSDLPTHQPQLPAIRLWDEIGSPRMPPTQDAAMVTPPPRSGR